MPSALLSKKLWILLLSPLFQGCGINEYCVTPKDLSDGTYHSVPKTVDSDFPLAVARSDLSMTIDKVNKMVEISYSENGKTVLQKWRIQ